jgi:hypothetical protein
MHGGRQYERLSIFDPDRLALPAPYALALPLEPPEVWCAGVTYERSRDAREEESAVKDVYLPQAKVYAGACALGPAILSRRQCLRPCAEDRG